MATQESPAFAVGQRWLCKGRSADEKPTLLINLVEPHPQGGLIYHVTAEGLKLRHPAAPGGVVNKMAHLPVTAMTLQHSVVEPAGTAEVDPAYLEGYRQWRAAFEANQAGVFGNTLANILVILEKQFNGIPNVPPPGFRRG